MKRYYILIILLSISTLGLAQSLFEPNYALKSPQTLEIINLEIKEDLTLISISIENLVEGGYFCIDPATYIINDRGEKLLLSGLSGLPLCPDSYKFNRVGEIKYVKLKFPALNKESRWIDIIEECDANCLAVYGICLDQSLNAELNICFRDIEKGRIADAIKKFETLRIKLTDSGNPILGSIYLNLITLYEQTGNPEEAGKLKNQLITLEIPHKELFLSGIK